MLTAAGVKERFSVRTKRGQSVKVGIGFKYNLPLVIVALSGPSILLHSVTLSGGIAKKQREPQLAALSR